MNAYDYLIIGGGMTADAAVKGIRELDPDGAIAILSNEADPPYSRPPLSKGLWNGKKNVKDLDCGTQENSVTLFLNRTATEIRRAEHCVVDSENEVHGYNRLLLATGGSPRRLPFDNGSVVYYRTLADYRALSQDMGDKKHYAVVGGGFIGCEMAAAMSQRGNAVTMIYPEDAPGAGIFPEEVSHALSNYYREKGISMLEGLKLSQLEQNGTALTLHLENGRSLEVDGVIAGIGIVPNTDLAERAGLNVTDGIVVDHQLRTRDDAIFAAGDVANFYVPALSQRMRVEHEDNALTMGRMAGRNMAGDEETYEHLPYFYSDLFEVGYEAVGHMDATYETVGVWQGIHDPGAWAYIREGQVCGVLLWNLFGQIDTGRGLIETRQRFARVELEENLKRILDAAKD